MQMSSSFQQRSNLNPIQIESPFGRPKNDFMENTMPSDLQSATQKQKNLETSLTSAGRVKNQYREKSSPSKLNSQQRKRNEFEGTFKINRNDLNPKIDSGNNTINITNKKEMIPDKGKGQKT